MKNRTSNTVTATAALALVTLVLPPVYAQRQPSQASQSSQRTDASAKRLDVDRTSGFTLGLYTLAVPGLSITGQDVSGAFETDFGQGVGLSVDYGFNRMFSAFASLDIAKQRTAAGTFPSGDLGLSHFELGGRLHLHTSDPNTIPYLSASVGRRSLGAYVTDEETGDSGDLDMSGYMVSAGGGIRHFFSPSLALDGGVELGYGSFSHLNTNGVSGDWLVNATTSIRLRAGLSWRP